MEKTALAAVPQVRRAEAECCLLLAEVDQRTLKTIRSPCGERGDRYVQHWRVLRISSFGSRKPPSSVLLCFRVGPLPHPPRTYPVFPAVHADRNDAGGRRYWRPAAVRRAGAAVKNRSMKN
jgi:hypothetical protein